MKKHPTQRITALALSIAFLSLLTFLKANPEQFTVATFNVQNWGRTGRFLDGEFQQNVMKPQSERDAVISIIRELNADVIIVQEIILEEAEINVRDIISALKRSGMDYPHNLLSTGSDGRIGILVLSRLPFLEKNVLNEDEYRLRDDTGKLHVFRVQRGFAYVAVAPQKGIRIDILGAHFKSRLPHSVFKNDEQGISGELQMRRQEALLLRSHVLKILHERPDAHIIVAGDLNDTTRHRNNPPGPIEILAGQFGEPNRLTILDITDNVGDYWTHYFHAQRSYDRIDMILVTQNLASSFISEKSFVYRKSPNGPDWRDASDHRAVRAVFRIEGSTN